MERQAFWYVRYWGDKVNTKQLGYMGTDSITNKITSASAANIATLLGNVSYRIFADGIKRNRPHSYPCNMTIWSTILSIWVSFLNNGIVVSGFDTFCLFSINAVKHHALYIYGRTEKLQKTYQRIGALVYLLNCGVIRENVEKWLLRLNIMLPSLRLQMAKHLLTPSPH